MIIQFLFNVLLSIANVLFGWLPQVTTIPYVDSYIVTAVGGIRTLAVAFPIYSVILEVSLIYLGFRIGLVILKVFLGHRSPHFN